MIDFWEVDQFKDMRTANETSDYDRDGYTDRQEFLNQLNGETDPKGGEYDPKILNAPGGTGYAKTDDDFWILMMPVLINAGKQQ